MHFCVLTARLYGLLPVPRNTSLNWFMPALVNKSVGSSSGTTLDDGTNVCPCFSTKKSMNCLRISLADAMFTLKLAVGSSSRQQQSAVAIGRKSQQIPLPTATADCHCHYCRLLLPTAIVTVGLLC